MVLAGFTALLLLSSIAIAQKDNGEECSCFRTNGSSAAYFTYHDFYDYRNLESVATPAILKGALDNTNADVTSAYFNSDAFTKDWTIPTWNNSYTPGSTDSGASTLMVHSANNIYIEAANDSNPDYTTHLTLRTFRQPTFQSAAEIDTVAQNYHHLSARFLARVIGSPGACAGLFTYLDPVDDNPDTVQEADIEILTSGPKNLVHYTNQPSENDDGPIPAATTNASVPFGRDWTQWMIYRLDWTEGLTTWYVDGEKVAEIALQAPKDPAGLIVNMWGQGGSWTGNMSTYGEAFLQLQWIEVAYNTSGPVTGGVQKRNSQGASGVLERRKGTPGCAVVCGVDEQVNVTGTPAFLYNSTGTAPGMGSGRGSWAWVPLFIVGFAIFGLF